MKIGRIITAILLLCILHTISIAQVKNQNDPWFFIQITDPQFGMFTKNEGFEKETILYEKAVDKINKLKPDFVVITGDFVHSQKSASSHLSGTRDPPATGECNTWAATTVRRAFLCQSISHPRFSSSDVTIALPLAAA